MEPIPSIPPLTFLWHDYETFGANGRRDRPAQFAAVRTDADLNELGEPLMLYCQPAPDFLPDSVSCLITGITPQHCLQHGLPEWQFAKAIAHTLSHPGTIGVGYNTIRFDDEFTRHLFWRNLIEPYAREWQNDCGRWDLLDVVRTAYALRPDGIIWPQKPEGGASFKLTDLTAANGLVHEAAHDALSDVRATIALARLLKTAQPRLFDFCLGLHKKRRVLVELGLPATQAHAKPFWHVSGMFGAERGCLALMWPLAMHPQNKNELLAWDLLHDPRELATLNAADIRQRMFTKAVDLPAGLARLPIKTIHMNKSPMVIANLKVLTPAMAQRWGIDVDAQLEHAALARDLPDMSAIWSAVYSQAPDPSPTDVDSALYDGFVGDADRRRLEALAVMTGAELAMARPNFDDARMPELLFRYRARNFPDALSADDAQRWDAHRAARLLDGEGGARSMAQLQEEIATLMVTAVGNGPSSADCQDKAILMALRDYADSIVPRRGR
jgi:exodeoxyribonuclease-1